MNCTPKVGQYNILKYFGGVFFCQKENRTQENSRKQL